MGIRTVAPSGILIGKFCKQKCLLIICNTVPIKFTELRTAARAGLPAQRPDIPFPLFTRVSVLPIKITPVGDLKYSGNSAQKKGMISHPLFEPINY
jgi:hypothetical protein